MGWTATTVVTAHSRVVCDSLRDLDGLYADLDGRTEVAVTRDDAGLCLVATQVLTTTQTG